ncbi:MAG: hypothetical protein IBX69_17665 [Anaerolineales bacterium]|nr:hypothetical protein [Anaerolineales bacterium]
MDVHKLSTREVGEMAKSLVAAKLLEFGISIEMPKGNKNIVIAKPGEGDQALSIRVKSRRLGDWQIPTTVGRSPQEKVDEIEFWVLVDFTIYPDDPDYYIMSGSWLRRNIYEDHQNYLLSHGGKRPVTPKSTHHKVRLENVERWKDRWDILGLM